MKIVKRMLPILLALMTLTGCVSAPTGSIVNIPGAPLQKEPEVLEHYLDQVDLAEVELEDEEVALASSPAAQMGMLLPEASGKVVAKNTKATIDYSNTKDGYVMVKFTQATDKRLKVRVTGPSGDPYTYNIPAQTWQTFPLSDGNGDYKVTVYQHTGEGSKYATVLSKSFSVKLTDEFAPFLRPNQYVDYEPAKNTIAKAEELTKDMTDPLEMVEAVYTYVVNNFTYDKKKAKSVQSGYLPVLDDVLEAKKGICFDYAAVMTGMLRSRGVPCKLIVGYAGDVYHAWITVYSENTGWVNGAIYFNGTSWQRMDPTFASSGKSSDAIMKYIGDGTNYNEKYAY